jgi:hypothetical protein
MNVVGVRVKGRSNSLAGAGSLLATAVLATAPCEMAWAFDEVAATNAGVQSMTAPAEKPRSQLQVSTSTLPRFDSTDSSGRSTNVDLSWLSPGRSAVGVSVGLTNTEGSNSWILPPRFASVTNVDFGVRWRYTTDGNYRVDVTAWRRLPQPDAVSSLLQERDASYGARVEMQLASAKRGFVADRAFLGFQLESGARVGLRRSGHAPMIYYRNGF